MPQILDVIAKENLRYKRNELELFVLKLPQYIIYGDDLFIRTRLFPVDVSGLTSFLDYRIAH